MSFFALVEVQLHAIIPRWRELLLRQLRPVEHVLLWHA